MAGVEVQSESVIYSPLASLLVAPAVLSERHAATSFLVCYAHILVAARADNGRFTWIRYECVVAKPTARNFAEGFLVNIADI